MAYLVWARLAVPDLMFTVCLPGKTDRETESADRLEGDEGEVQELWFRRKKKDFDR